MAIISVLQFVPANANAGDGCENSNNNILFEKLSLDLQVRLLKGLSLKELARLRLVCKYFNSLLSSDPCFNSRVYEPPLPNFFLHSHLAHRCPAAPPLGDNIFYFPDETPDTSRWIKARFLPSHLVDGCPGARSLGDSIFLLHEETRGTSSWLPPFGCPRSLYLASNDGFLCFEGHGGPQFATIIVYNPTSPNCWNVLTVPEGMPIVLQNCLMGIAFVRKLGACKIVLSGPGPSSNGMTWTLIYDAKADTWRKLPELDDMFTPHMKEPFVLNGIFYWLVWSYKQQAEMVMSLDIENDKWEEPLLLNGGCYKPICMAEVDEQPWVISVSAQDSQKLELWKLDIIQGKRKYTWVRTITAPVNLVSSNNISVFGQRNVLCVGSKGRFWGYHIREKVWRYVALFREHIWQYRDFDFAKRKDKCAFYKPSLNFAQHKCTFYKPSLLRFQGDKLLQGNGHFLNVKMQPPVHSPSPSGCSERNNFF